MARKRKAKHMFILTPETLPNYLWNQSAQAEEKRRMSEKEDDEDMVNFWSGVSSGLAQAATTAEKAIGIEE